MRHEHGLFEREAIDLGATHMLNRAALILRYRQPFVDWINAVDPAPASHTLTLAEVNEEHTVYLIEVEELVELESWARLQSQGAVRDRAQRLVHRPRAMAPGPLPRQAP